MNYCGLNLCDTANGDGIRISLFVSGCRIHCKGCFNRESWSFSSGSEYTQEIQNKILKEIKKDYISGLSLLGGDPLEPEHLDTLINLCKEVKKIPNKSIWLWTGRLYSKIKDNLLLDYIDVLIDGPFILDQYDPNLKYRGSKNQKINFIKR